MNMLLQGSRIIVVGGAGFVGSNLVRKLLIHSPSRVVVVDNLLSAERLNVPDDDRVEFWEGSITNDEILEKIQDDFDFVFHLATFHGNQNSIFDPIADHENNTLTSLKLFNRLKNFKKLKKVVYSSAGCTVAEKTFGEAHATTEEEPVSLFLDSPYQMSKIFGEFYANYYFKQYGLPVVKARFQNVYGPGEILGAGKWRGTPATVWRNVTPTFVYRALKRMPLVVENDGVATRDFIYVDDICEGLIACAVKGSVGDVYNLASGLEISIKVLAEKINAVTENPTPIQWGPKRPWDNSGKRFGSTDKAKERLCFGCHVPFDEGLKRTITWTRENLPVIDRIISKHRAEVPDLPC